MKKKIAICANGWNYESLREALNGIRGYAAQEDFDIFVFLSFASYSEHVSLMQGELNVYDLMEPEEYDGIIVFSTALNSEKTAVEICSRAKEKHIPVVSIGMELDGIHSVCVSNDEGMRELVTHLVREHRIKRVYFIGGTPDHVDSVARLKVTREVLRKYGIPFTDDDIGYGKWANRYTAEAIDELLASGGELPDAIICANDIMAMAACTELNARGVDVPRDVIVTGFDDCRDGTIFYPSLSSVAQNYNEIGYAACKLIFDEINGMKKTMRKTVHSSFVCGNSCGCRGDRDYDEMRKDFCRNLFKRTSDAKLLEQNERTMRSWLTDMPSYDMLKETLNAHYEQNHQFEGSGFYICVNDEFFRNVMASEQELWEMKKDCRIEVLVALKNGEIVYGLNADFKTIVPGYRKNIGEQHVYFIMPMHHFQYDYGYVVLTDFPYLFSEEMIYPYMEKLQQSLKLMRTNLRLKMLYDKDQMTGLYNRFGYEDKALPLYEESLAKRSKLMVMFVDINYMKMINDEYGHLHGDNAILTVVAAIKATIGDHKNTLAVRFGGDEFLIITPDCSEEEAAAMKESILVFLGECNRVKTVPYDISVSIGYVLSSPADRPEADLQDYIREADRLMYEIKKEMHMKNDRRRSDRK
ncbi:MAG: GGDEF domain-containing protein [Lachnospiraceae bacterium]|nr:GGDEF domain-containing protein [Lachnospiraceae bacterium]